MHRLIAQSKPKDTHIQIRVSHQEKDIIKEEAVSIGFRSISKYILYKLRLPIPTTKPTK